MSACYESMADPKVLQGVAAVFAGLLSEGWGDAFKDRGWATTEAIQEMNYEQSETDTRRHPSYDADVGVPRPCECN